MDFEVFVKAGTFVLAAVMGAVRVIYDISIRKRSQMREEYKFAKEFLDEVCNKELHPFLKEKGYQAIAGDNQLSSKEIEYLLSLRGPDRALRDYVLGRPYLEHLPHAGDLQITFKKKYREKWSRRWRMAAYILAYIVLAFLAFSPLVLSSIFDLGLIDTLVAFAGCMAVFGPYAWVSLKTAARIYRADHLVRNQHKHTQRIMLDGSIASFQKATSK